MQISQLVLPIALIAMLYFLLIRPQQQRAKQQQSMIGSMKAGDEIVTIGGIYATVVSVGDRIRVAVADGSELELAKMAIGRVIPAEERESRLEADAPDDAEALDETDVVADVADTDAEEGKQP